MDLHRRADGIVTVGSASPPALELVHVTKHFGSCVALDDVSIAVRPGTIHAVLGENGAGKTTLMHVAYGLLRPDSGEVRVAGRPVRLGSPFAAISVGVGMVHQHFTLVPAMTVQENLALGGRGRLRPRDMVNRVNEIAARTGFALDPAARVDALSVGAQQRVEIAKALVRNASILILDEPTAVLAPAEIDDLLRWLRAYVAAGHSAVLITHKLREALAVADEVTVLRAGRVVHVASANTVSEQQLAESILGTASTEIREAAAPVSLASEPAFVADQLCVAGPTGRMCVLGASFVIRGGELVGVVAVEGAGQHELLRALAGRCAVAGGHLKKPAIVGFVPEDRHRDAVLLDRSLTENIALRGAGNRRGRLDWPSMHAHAVDLIQSFNVLAANTNLPVRALSGGNQQKLVLARELERLPDASAPEALVVENPTRGLDVRATADVHARLREAAARGAAVVMYSSDLDEVLAIATRVLVLFEGTVREMPVDRDAIGRAMLGVV